MSQETAQPCPLVVRNVFLGLGSTRRTPISMQKHPRIIIGNIFNVTSWIIPFPISCHFCLQTCSHPMISWFGGLDVFYRYQSVSEGALGLWGHARGPGTLYTPWGTQILIILDQSGVSWIIPPNTLSHCTSLVSVWAGGASCKFAAT